MDLSTLPGDLRLRPVLTCVWPMPSRVQIGLSRGAGVVLHGVLAEDALLIETLRRPRPGRARRLDRRSQELLQLLAAAGVLSRGSHDAGPQPDLTPDARLWALAHRTGDDGSGVLAARRSRTVTVVGAGRLGATLATTLASAGVGTISVVDRFRRDAVAEQVRAAGGEARTSARFDPTEATDLVVLVEHGVADAAAADPLLSADVPHLSVLVRDAEVVVGPLVVPGDGPCLRCLDLHRADRDPAWPATLRQVLAGRGTGPFAAGPEETALSTLSAGLTAVQVLGQLDAAALPEAPPATRPPARGATLEVELPHGLVARRVWPVHPRCGCHRLGPAAGRPGVHLGE